MERGLAAHADVLTEQTGANLCSLQLYQGPGARAGEITAHIYFVICTNQQTWAQRALILTQAQLVRAIILMTERTTFTVNVCK
jgi:hypothetical protein